MLQILQLSFSSCAKHYQFDSLPTLTTGTIVGLADIVVPTPVAIFPFPLPVTKPWLPKQIPKADPLKIIPANVRREFPNIRTN